MFVSQPEFRRASTQRLRTAFRQSVDPDSAPASASPDLLGCADRMTAQWASSAAASSAEANARTSARSFSLHAYTAASGSSVTRS